MGVSTNVLNRCRRALAGSALRPLLARLGIVSLGRRVYNRGLFRAGTRTVRLGGRDVVFRVTTDAEVRHFDGQHAEDELMARIAGSLRAGDRVIDAGANIGMVSIMAAKGVAATASEAPGPVVVHAFEPEPRNAARLRENIALNAPAEVRVHEMGLGDRAGVLRMYASSQTGDGTHSLMEARAEGRHAIEVKVQTLDEVVKSGAAPQPTVLKIDVEGAEGMVLEGAQRTLRDPSLREVFIELHPSLWGGSGVSIDGFKRQMEGAGLDLVWEVKRHHEVHQHYQRRGVASEGRGG